MNKEGVLVMIGLGYFDSFRKILGLGLLNFVQAN